MKGDAQLKKDAEGELEWTPSIHASEIGVAIKDGVMALSGYPESFVEKYAAQRVAKRVAAMKAVTVESDVKLNAGNARSDTDIARAAEAALAWHSSVPVEGIQVKVEKGWVTLSGEMDWEYQRSAAANVVRPLLGVVGVYNLISVRPRTVSEASASSFAIR